MRLSLFSFIFCQLVLASCESLHSSGNDVQKANVQAEVENCEFSHFKEIVMQELKELNSGKIRMEYEMNQLRMENLYKERKMAELEEKVKALEKGHASVKSRRYVGENIAFTAYLDHSVHNLTHDQPVIYNKVLFNDGNGYNPQTGMFRAPASGVYLFSYSVGAKILPGVQLHQYDVFTRLMIGNTHQLSAVAESTSQYDDEQGSTTAIVFVEEASNVWVKHEHRGGDNLFAENTERVTSFTGALLYEKEFASNSAIIG